MENNELQKRMDNYERIIKEIIGAFSLLDFHIVVESTIHKKIIPINREDENDKLLMGDISIIVNDFAKKYNKTPITFDIYKSLVNPPKPKSFCNNEIGIFADKVIPLFFDTNKDKVKIITSFERLSLNGYPDEVITDKYGGITYLEVKTTSRRDIGSPRDFFFSPLKNSKKKIKNDGHHLLLCFDTFEQKEKEFIITGWCLIDLFNIKVSMKPEFNTDNLELYKKENILLEVKF
ncbi:MAG: hypothetical protein AB1349_04595 [Elusimicrobiota bacterium]